MTGTGANSWFCGFLGNDSSCRGDFILSNLQRPRMSLDVVLRQTSLMYLKIVV